MTISMNTIQPDLNVPLFWAEMDSSAANTTQDSGPALIMGYASSDSEIPVNTLTIMPSANLAGQLAGRGSQLHRMVSAYRTVDPFGELWVVAVTPPEGTEATSTLTIAGTASESGTVNLYISNQRVAVAVSLNDPAATVAAAIVASITANPDLAVNASATAGVVTLTAKHAGLYGNDIPVALNYLGRVGSEVTPTGLNITMTTMSGGAGSPTLTAAIAALGDEMFDYIGVGFNDSASLNTMALEMNDTSGRWSYIRQLYGHVYAAKIGTLSALVAIGDTFNNQHISLAGYEPKTQTAADELVGYRTARNAVFIRIDPARPTQTGELTGAYPAPVGARFILSEQQSLLSHGIATAYTQGSALYIQRERTTYKKNVYGVADNSYFDSETLHTSAYVIRRLKSIITSKYPRHKLADDGTRFGPGQAVVTPAVIKGELCAEYRQMELEGIVENFAVFKKYLIVERNATNPNRLDVLFPPDYVNQLRVFALKNQFRLQYSAAESA